MAIPKRGSRSIVVDGTTYRWYVRRKPSYSQEYAAWNGWNGGTTFAVELADSEGQVLVVLLSQSRPDTYAEPKVAITPAQIAHHIKRALKEGWKPTESGGAFHLTE